ncbi:glycosyltransferase family 25 protein [Rhizobium sp. BK491]|uniref:glycosyltransferase family 25 protein n=1 Tax=Rhizobium sp. BK491 TaxID=2587009 RepID=UPI001614E490|nr:glycosyltransferase family 25 protein [Rhizobium sp. BK491]MBB3571860.1 GR25 family glycosyltransferase involved in LPS biosynthesis [Rhizobium sp. BK491]
MEQDNTVPASKRAITARRARHSDCGESLLSFSSQFGRQDSLSTTGLLIHLLRVKQRRQHAENLLKLLPFSTSILPAVDGRLLSKRECQAFYQRQLHQPFYPFELTSAEIGCFLSHRKAWQAIVDQNIDIAFVIEDDIELDDDFYRGLALALAHMGPDDLIRFPMRRGRENGRQIVKAGKIALIEPNCPGLGMGAQLITRGAAIKLLKATEQVDRPVDVFLQMFWLTGVIPKSVTPSGVHEISGSLGGSTLRQRKPVLQKCIHEILRPLYRRRIKRLARLAGRRRIPSSDVGAR